MNKLMLPAVLVAAILAGGASAQEVTLRAVYALSKTTDFAKRFEDFVDVVNEDGKGVIQIDIVGGPEAIPALQQDSALRNGVVDIQSGPATYYQGTLPASAAFNGSTVDVDEIRQNGAWDYLSDIWADRLNAKLLGWIGGGVQFYVYLKEEPVYTAEGDLDLSSLKMRSAPPYRDWFSSMGADNIMLSQSEIYPALERGIVDGFGSPVFSTDLGTNRLVNSRVGPGVWQNDCVIMVNMTKWNSLSDEAKAILQDAALKIEDENKAYFARRIAEEDAQILADGIKVVEIPGEAGDRHIRKAHDARWNELTVNSPEAAEILRPLMYPSQ